MFSTPSPAACPADRAILLPSSPSCHRLHQRTGLRSALAQAGCLAPARACAGAVSGATKGLVLWSVQLVSSLWEPHTSTSTHRVTVFQTFSLLEDQPLPSLVLQALKDGVSAEGESFLRAQQLQRDPRPLRTALPWTYPPETEASHSFGCLS